ncbi:MAG: glycosyltransferase [Clostridiales bacterium]|jgi:glycosyltransferase involved in cell wall biosynthesis|nr:glycosyltransferase [Clostridiales bacterium]
MRELSLCMIVKDEEKYLADCLNSVHGVMDEIIIVDTGSTDSTTEIAKRYTDKIYHFKWINDFAAARNFSFSKATKDFVMWLDADDIITEVNRQKLLLLKEKLTDKMDCIIAEYYATFDGEGNPSSVFPRTRIVRRAANLQWFGAIHEMIQNGREGVYVDIFITHNKKEAEFFSYDRNLNIIMELIKAGTATVREYFYLGLMKYFTEEDDEAFEAFDKVINSEYFGEFDPMEMFVAMHNMYRKHGEKEKAIEILESNKKLMEDKAEYYCVLGLAYKEDYNDLETASHLFKQALRCRGTFNDKKYPSQRNLEYYYYAPHFLLGKIHLQKKDAVGALNCFERAASYRISEQTDQLIQKLKELLIKQRELEYA